MVLKGIRQTGTYFLIGSPSFAQERDRFHLFNSAYLVAPNGEVLGRYDKAHLVPFGEYVPFGKYFPFIGKMVEGVGDFKAGEKGKTLAWDTCRLGIQICYEIIFPSLSRALTQNGAALLINMTNDAWYGRSSGPYQHFSMVVFRAVENRRSLIRAANTGISGFIDPAGRILEHSALFEAKAMTRPLPIIRKKTLYTRHGDIFAVGCLAVVLIWGTLSWRRKTVRRFPKKL
jgi:apolipoprotein N-acyltransferase